MKKFLNIDLSDTSNLCPAEKVNVGSGATLICNKAKATEALEVRKFKQNARNFLVKLIEKFRERSPLRYQLCLYISSLSPTQIAAGNVEFLTNLFNKVFEPR